MTQVEMKRVGEMLAVRKVAEMNQMKMGDHRLARSGHSMANLLV